ncbi:hypothetical protein V9R50_003184 [Vibrio cholerae]
MSEITSEQEYEVLLNQLSATSEHPLFGESDEDIAYQEKTIALLDRWRSNNPIPEIKEESHHKASLHLKGFWSDI